MLGGIVLGMAWFTAFVIAHALLFHLRSVRKRFQAILNLFVSAIAAQAISCVIVAAMGAGRIGGVRIAVCALAGAVVMCSFWVLYMPFYYVLAASTSIRTLIAVQHAPRGELSVAQLRARFASPSILRHRMDVMARYGNVARQGGGYVLTVKGRRTARVFAGIKRLWKLGPGG